MGCCVGRKEGRIEVHCSCVKRGVVMGVPVLEYSTVPWSILCAILIFVSYAAVRCSFTRVPYSTELSLARSIVRISVGHLLLVLYCSSSDCIMIC